MVSIRVSARVSNGSFTPKLDCKSGLTQQAYAYGGQAFDFPQGYACSWAAASLHCTEVDPWPRWFCTKRRLVHSFKQSDLTYYSSYSRNWVSRSEWRCDARATRAPARLNWSCFSYVLVPFFAVLWVSVELYNRALNGHAPSSYGPELIFVDAFDLWDLK